MRFLRVPGIHLHVVAAQHQQIVGSNPIGRQSVGKINDIYKQKLKADNYADFIITGSPLPDKRPLFGLDVSSFFYVLKVRFQNYVKHRCSHM